MYLLFRHGGDRSYGKTVQIDESWREKLHGKRLIGASETLNRTKSFGKKWGHRSAAGENVGINDKEINDLQSRMPMVIRKVVPKRFIYEINQLDKNHNKEKTRITPASNSSVKEHFLNEFVPFPVLLNSPGDGDLARFATESEGERCVAAVQAGDERCVAPSQATDEDMCSSSASEGGCDGEEGIFGANTEELPTTTTHELQSTTNDTHSLRLKYTFSASGGFGKQRPRESREELIRSLLTTALESKTTEYEQRVPNDDLKPNFRHVLALRHPNVPQLVALPLFGANPFGDFASEGARLQTFERYEPASYRSALRLANAGFYFTDEENTLKCYSCGVTFSYTEDNRLDNPYEIHRRLRPDCPHVNGRDPRNVFVQDDQRRAQSFLDITGQGAVAVTSSPGPALQGILHDARQGLHELRNHLARIGFLVEPLSSQVTQPAIFVLREDPSAMSTPVYNNPSVPSPLENRMSNGVDHQNPRSNNADPEARPSESIPESRSPPPPASADVTSALGDIVDRHQNVQEPLPNGDYDPSRATHTNYRDYTRRLASYGSWPETHAQSPEDLAQYGFFYTGVEDCVRCHYCGLGLKHWDPDDRPLDEHVRWRSSCGYLRALLGDDTIARILAELGRRLRQTGAENEGTGHDETGALRSVARSAHSIVASVATMAPSSNHPAWPQDTPPTPASLMTSPAAQTARDMGFSDDVIQRAITALLGTRAGARAVTSQHLVQAILYTRERDRGSDDNWNTDSDSGDDDVTSSTLGPQAPLPVGVTSSQGPRHELSPAEIPTGASPGETEGERGSPAVASGRAGISASNSADDPRQSAERLERENQELRERRRCKICLDNDVSILFLPCGHLVCCAECAAALLRCPICRVRIRGRVRTQLAPRPSSPVKNSSNNNNQQHQ